MGILLILLARVAVVQSICRRFTREIRQRPIMSEQRDLVTWKTIGDAVLCKYTGEGAWSHLWLLAIHIVWSEFIDHYLSGALRVGGKCSLLFNPVLFCTSFEATSEIFSFEHCRTLPSLGL